MLGDSECSYGDWCEEHARSVFREVRHTVGQQTDTGMRVTVRAWLSERSER